MENEEEEQDSELDSNAPSSYTLQKHIHTCFCCTLTYYCVDNKDICKLLSPDELICIQCDNLREGIDF